MSKTVKKSFVVAVPPARAWEVFANGEERSQWEALNYEIDPVPGGRVHWELPGLECDGKVVEADPFRLLRHTEATGPHSGSEITVTFEEVDGGTRISITHAGFGASDPWEEALGGTSLGWDQAIADLFAYLQTGLPARRFTVALADPGARLAATPAGLEVREVRPASLASAAGLRPGDLILTAGGSPVYSFTDLWVVLRGRGPGAVMEIEYVRDGRRLAGSGILAPFGG